MRDARLIGEDAIRVALLIALALLLGACEPVQAESSALTSLWGTVYALGQAEQSAAPALWPTASGAVAGWIGADETGVHQDVRALTHGVLSPMTVLPLPPVHPFAQQFYPAGGVNYHQLWLDAAAPDENRLYSAIITPSLQVERGPTPISDRLTLRYTAVPAGNGGLWTVWSGGLLAEPALYAQYIDADGRPRQATLIARGADYPALTRANDDTLYLVWLQTQSLYTTIREGVLQDGVLAAAESFAVIDLSPDTWVIDVYAGLDQTHLYAFFNVMTDDVPASWVVARALDSRVWGQPAHVGLNSGGETTVETGFNTGTANRTQASNPWQALRWVRPLNGQFSTLPVAAHAADRAELLVAYFGAGSVIGYQSLLAVDTLLAPPGIFTDRSRHLYVTWAQPTDAGYAELRLTSTRG